ncbi:unnamed protein product [Gordionus sp. m RMFG-2023]
MFLRHPFYINLERIDNAFTNYFSNNDNLNNPYTINRFLNVEIEGPPPPPPLPPPRYSRIVNGDSVRSGTIDSTNNARIMGF